MAGFLLAAGKKGRALCCLRLFIGACLWRFMQNHFLAFNVNHFDGWQ